MSQIVRDYSLLELPSMFWKVGVRQASSSELELSMSLLQKRGGVQSISLKSEPIVSTQHGMVQSVSLMSEVSLQTCGLSLIYGVCELQFNSGTSSSSTC